MKKKEIKAAGMEGMSDANLSQRLGQYQRQARTWLRVGLLGMAGGLIAAVAVQNTVLKAVLVAVLFGGGLCCVLFLSSGAQKKLEVLMREQLGDFFRAELERSFGPALHTQKMQIDRPLLNKLCPPDGRWEACETEDFREGRYRGIHFAAANVRLYHVYEQGHGKGSLGTSRDMVFKGVVLRCETRIPAPSAICVTAEREQDAHALLTPQFTAWLGDFEQHVKGQISGFSWEDKIFSLLLETDYSFAAVTSDVDMRDLDAVRRSYCNSLRAMEETLNLLLQYTSLL